MAILGGSPLGLIGITSAPIGGNSTFNGGKTRNVDVATYNSSKALSLFTGKRVLRAWPSIKTFSGSYNAGDRSKESFSDEFDTKGLDDVDYELMRKTGGKDGDKYKGVTNKALHNNDVYDTSILNIIEKLAPTKAALRPSDFAYLKNLGVYPNNRLMIVRRFASPTDDNIMVNRKTDIPSLANVISWVTSDADFVSIDFGEVWDEASADFTNFLDSLGKDFGRKAEGMGLGGLANAGGGILPLPGFTEIFQRKFLMNIGLLDEGADAGSPAGNPNLIKEAKARKTVGYGVASSGLMCTISFAFVAEYELKFISGLDPSIVWMDIIGNILRFGTSESSNYGLSREYAAKLKKWTNNPDKLLGEMVKSIKTTIEDVKADVLAAIQKIYDKATQAAMGDFMDAKKEEKTKDKNYGEFKTEKALAEKTKKASEGLLDKLGSIGQDILYGTIQKYRTEVIGIVNALTGLPSTPWHITIGNPLRPVFCSGDMLTQSVKISMGSQLAFNDLPSSIKVEFTLVNARPLGLQEIMSKFNSGYLRTVDIQKSFYELESTTQAIGGLAYEQGASVQKPTTDQTATTNAGGGNTKVDSQAAGSTKAAGGQQATTTIEKDPKKTQG